MHGRNIKSVRLGLWAAVVLLAAVLTPHGVRARGSRLALHAGADAASGAPASGKRSLVAVSRSATLASSYALPVVQVPEPPVELRGSVMGVVVPAPGPECPAEVRAVISGDDTFAVVVAGEERRVVRAGDVVSLGATRWRVLSVQSDGVAFRRRDAAAAAVHCPPGK